MGFIQSIGDAIAGKRIGEESIEMSESTVKLVHLLETLSTWVDNIKPVEQQQRFGNRAFKEWHNKLIEVRPFYKLIIESAYFNIYLPILRNRKPFLVH